MKRKFLLGIALIACIGYVACQGPSTGEKSTVGVENKIDQPDVMVYYFHGKQRCKTCVAVGNLAQETIMKNYGANPNVKFLEINTSEKSADSLVAKYQVAWNALIIAKGEDKIDITQAAFAHAVANPDTVSVIIKKEVDKRLQK